MAEFLLTFAVEQTLEKGISIAVQEIARVWGLKKDLRNLGKFTQSIHAKVKKAGNIQASNGQDAKTLLVELQNVLYSAEDVLEDYSYEILRRKIELQPRPMLRIRDLASRNNPIFFRVKMACKVKKINESLADIEKEALRHLVFTGTTVTDGDDDSNDQVNRVTVSYPDKTEPDAIGRASEVEAIMKMLQLSSSTTSPLTVVSIVGFGGLGKTTLARMVFNREKTTELFDEKIWVCVSEPFDVKTILKGMLETLDKNAGGLGNDEAILRHLESKLKDKRLFLVLDDVWQDNPYECKILRSHLLTICGRAGSFIILTTRKLGVAEAMDTRDEHVVELKELKDTECWDIIKNKCEMQWEELMPKQLEKIGLEIGRKCKGVPLAAKVIGGTLWKKRTEKEWSSIEKSVAWDQIDQHVSPVLKLSFHHLDSSLKQCFVFCSLFPKDFEYEKQKLIEWWMAEGFLNTMSTTNRESSEKKSMEDVGEECFNALIFHSFFQDVQVDKFGNIIACKMHDLLHDVAASVSNYKMLKWKEQSTFFVRTSHHQHQPTVQELEKGGGRNVRCVISYVVGEVSHMFSTFKSLRSLDLSSAGLEELPSIVGRLKQLRYLNISYNRYMKELPEFITKLYNLQSIWLIFCPGITKLPTNLTNLVRLRHIHFYDPNLKIYNVGRLIELRTLPYFVVREEEGFRINELNNLNELTGNLEISGLQNVRDKEEAERANLKEKNLTELILKWDSERNDSIDSERNNGEVLEGLLPSPNIKMLNIENYRGVKFPNWNYLSQLEELTLRNCGKCKLMPSLGHLPQLKSLVVYDMESLEEWVAAEAVKDEQEKSVVLFPLLEELTIRECPRLRSIPLRHLSSLVSLNIESCESMKYLSNDIQNLPSLDHLRIKECRNLVSLSNLQQLKSLKELRIEYCTGLTSLSKGLVSLQTLEMNSCDLSEDAFCGLSSLQFLSLSNVRMKSIPNIECPSSLEALKILYCPEITSVPNWLKFCTSLRKLHIRWCKKLISIEDDIISSLTQLKELKLGPFSKDLENFPGFNSIHHLHSPSIEELRLYGWKKLKSLPPQLQHLTSLRHLSLYEFEGVSSINEDIFRSLTQLKKLRIGPFSEELDEFPGLSSIHLLSSSLEKLEIKGWPKLKSLPQHLQHLTSLKKLFIRDFNGVETLPDWLGNLSSLQQLQLWLCKNLKNLPTTIKTLPNLTTFQSFNCPLLKQRYNHDTGPDRNLISHVPNIYFVPG